MASQPWTPSCIAPLIRDRDYLTDSHGTIFKVIGDTHPTTHYLGYVKYHPDRNGDRKLGGHIYRNNTVVAKSFGILANRPDYYVYSDALGCVITGVPRAKITTHHSCRATLKMLASSPGTSTEIPVDNDLRAIIDQLSQAGLLHHFGITGSFLVGCFTPNSDIDLVCYGTAGYDAAQQLFADSSLIRRYTGDALPALYRRRARYMLGSDFSALITQEQRKLQGLTPSGAHINCEPLRDDDTRLDQPMSAKEIGEMSLLATITDHSQGLATPALYEIRAEHVLHSTIDDPHQLIPHLAYLRSYLGAYTCAFRTGDTVHISGKLVHLHHHGTHQGFGIELTPWTSSASYLASLTTGQRTGPHPRS